MYLAVVVIVVDTVELNELQSKSTKFLLDAIAHHLRFHDDGKGDERFGSYWFIVSASVMAIEL